MGEAPVTLVIDVANVMGARADGWWRDRPGAATRLSRQVSALAARGVPAARMPAAMPPPSYYVLVLEGQAKAAVTRIDFPHPRVRLVEAPGLGDDAIVAEAAELAGSCVVVTADRELRRRCEGAGAVVMSPRWLLGLL